MSRPTPEELWRIASQPDVDMEFERVLAMTPEEVRASLVSRGYDLAELEEQAREMWGMRKRRRSGFFAKIIASATFLAALVICLRAFGPMTPVIASALSASTMGGQS